MEPESRYKLIGAAVLALALLTAALAVWLSGTGVGSEFRLYSIHFERQSLEGLQIGGDVNMQGIKIGRVESFSIDRNNPNRVNVTIRVSRQTPVSVKTTATIARNLLTGIARINLETPVQMGPPLEVVPEGEDYPVIAEGTSDFDQLTRTANNLVISAGRSFDKLGELLDESNQETFSQALAGVRELAVGLAARLDSFDRTATSMTAAADALAQTARPFRSSSESIAGAVNRFGEQTAPVATQAQQTLAEARSALTEMRTAVTELSASTRSLEKELATLARQAQGATDVGTLELRATALQLRSGLEQLSQTLDRLQDPRAILVGPNAGALGPGESLK